MPIPKFNSYGLLPPGLYAVSLTEIEKTFAFSPKRHDMIEKGLKPITQILLTLKNSTVFIGGSFVTTKLFPNDIDGYILTQLDSETFTNALSSQENWRMRYRVDLHPALIGTEGYGSRTYWEEWFGKTKEAPPKAKGMLKLSLRR